MNAALPLADLVARSAQRGQLVRHDVLHLVDEDRRTDTEVAGQLAGGGEEFGEVEFEVAGVGPAARRRHVVRRSPPHTLAVLRSGLQCERLQDAEELIDPLGIAVPRSQLAARGVKRLRHRQPDRALGTRLDLAGPPCPGQSQRTQGVEQYGLADAAQS